jgi:hypothetical protein
MSASRRHELCIELDLGDPEAPVLRRYRDLRGGVDVIGLEASGRVLCVLACDSSFSVVVAKNAAPQSRAKAALTEADAARARRQKE